MAFNAELARETLAFIKNLPTYDEVMEAPSGAYDETTKVWAQGDWHIKVFNDVEDVCGTGMCFAGWLAFNAGYKDMTNGSCRKNPQQSWRPISEVADELLGTDLHMHDLFRGSNTLSDIEQEINRLEQLYATQTREAKDALGY